MNDHHQRLTVEDLLAERAATPTQRRAPRLQAPTHTVVPDAGHDADVIARIDAATPSRVAQMARERLHGQLIREQMRADQFEVPAQSRRELPTEPVAEKPSAVQWIDPMPPAARASAGPMFTAAPNVEPPSGPEPVVEATQSRRAEPAERAKPVERAEPDGSIMQPIVGAVAGAAVWSGFHWLWANQPALAFLAALVVVAGMVSIVRKWGHPGSVGVTVLVGLIMTVSPVALVVLAH